jgi:hypothetical protein
MKACGLTKWLLFAVFLTQTGPVLAFPCFFTPSRLTLREEIAQIHLVLFGQMAVPCSDGMSSELVIESIVKDHPIVAQRKVMPLGKSIEIGNREKLPHFLLFGDVEKGKVDFYKGLAVSPAVVPYLKGLLAFKADDEAGRLLYCSAFLTHKESAIADDAYLEFSNSEEGTITQVAANFSPVPLRLMLRNDETPSHRIDLYAFLLGHCGTNEDAVRLRRMAEKRIKKQGVAEAGILKGFTLLKPVEGWSYVRELGKKSDLPFLVRYRALNTARFFFTTRPGVVSRKEILSFLELMLDQKDIADLAIDDLRKCHCWKFTPRILAMWPQQTSKGRCMARSILRYAVQCPEPQAIQFVAEQRQTNTEELTDVEECLGLEKPMPPTKQ